MFTTGQTTTYNGISGTIIAVADLYVETFDVPTGPPALIFASRRVTRTLRVTVRFDTGEVRTFQGGDLYALG